MKTYIIKDFDMSSEPTVSKDLFRSVVDLWLADNQFTSEIDKSVDLYKSIKRDLSKNPKSLGWLMQIYRKEKDIHIAMLLRDYTDCNPVPFGHRGYVEQTCTDWQNWYKYIYLQKPAKKHKN